MAHSLYIDWQTCWSVRCMFIHSETHALKGRLTPFLQSDVWHLTGIRLTSVLMRMDARGIFLQGHVDWHLPYRFSARAASSHPPECHGLKMVQEGQGNREMRKKSGRTGRTRRTTREDQAEAGQETLTAPTWNPEPPTWQMIFRKKQIIRSA